VPIVSETVGLVAEIYVKLGDEVQEGAPIFRLDDSEQRAMAETGRRRISEIDAQIALLRPTLLLQRVRSSRPRGLSADALKPASRRSCRLRRQLQKPLSRKPKRIWIRL
jgi:multidrug efflux pump subunit AcrA (membrane-fusion protein)